MNNYTFSLLFWSFLHSNVSADEVSCATYRSKNNPLLINNDRSNLDDKYLTVIGHRGSSFHLPEHTLAGYRLAMELGADYIEPDLVPTKDGHLIAVHSIDLNITTDVASKFPDRFREGLISNNTDSTHFIGPITGYMSFDFTLEEIKTLKVKQRVEDTLARSQFFDWVFEIPTLEEILDLMLSWDDDVMKLIGRDFRPGLYAELKNPSFINNVAKLNSTVESMFLNSLKNHPGSEELFFNSTKYCEVGDLSNRDSFISASVREGFSEKVNEYKTKSHLGLAPLVFQCFEEETLEYLRNYAASENSGFNGVVPPNVLLVSFKQCSLDPELFFHISAFKHFLEGVGPDKQCLLQEGDGRGFVQKAHEDHFVVHAWTLRLESSYVDNSFKTAEEELRFLFCDIGVDGMFTENIDIAVNLNSVGCPKEAVDAPEKVINCEEKNTDIPIVAMFGATFGGFILGATVLFAFQLLSGDSRHHSKLKSIPDDEYEQNVFKIGSEDDEISRIT